ncbi:hypothetical protein ABTZ93_05465 [Streptomyces sp. NPDC097941]
MSVSLPTAPTDALPERPGGHGPAPEVTVATVTPLHPGGRIGVRTP